MKKFTLLLILNLSFLIIHSQKAKAQWVTIPDTAFVTWLTASYPGCMTGNQMDTTCTEIVNEDSVYIPVQLIYNLSGVKYFDNLTYLDIHNIVLFNLPSLPNSLKYLDCSYNYIFKFTYFAKYIDIFKLST